MPDTSGTKFDGIGLAANTAIASVGAGAAVIAATGLIWPAVIGAAAGAVVGYTATNQIPRQ